MSTVTLAQGPLGFPMPDAAARTVDRILRRLPATPEHTYRHVVVPQTALNLTSGERADISWISTESVDRVGEVVLASGMDDSQYRLNPVVTLGHDYDLPPVGTSVWRRRVSEGSLTGIKAKTHYPPCPDNWPKEQSWLPDQVFAMVQSGLLRGKSIGFLPLHVHVPEDRERRQRGWGAEVRLVVDEWLLLEYACVTIPANQHTLVEAVSKGMLSLDSRLCTRLGITTQTQVLPFTTEQEIEKAIQRGINARRLPQMIAGIVRNAVDRVSGRI